MNTAFHYRTIGLNAQGAERRVRPMPILIWGGLRVMMPGLCAGGVHEAQDVAGERAWYGSPYANGRWVRCRFFTKNEEQ